MIIKQTNIANNTVVIPEWLDNYIFSELSANYCRRNSDMVVLDWSKEEICSYLGTYFPRSYSESYCIFTNFLNKHSHIYESQKEISIFDLGCGTGGELIGFITAVKENLPQIRNINIIALDGNQHALRILEELLDKVEQITKINISSRLLPIVIEDFYDMDVVTSIIPNNLDFVITFKAICEFVTRKQFEDKNPYKHILETFFPKLANKGVICIADVSSYNDVSNDWLPKMLDKASCIGNVNIIERNEGFNESYYVCHSMKHSDLSKIAWRIYNVNNSII